VVTEPASAVARARLIMRHENHPGGSGTRLLLNVAVWTGIPLQRHATLDTALQFSCVDQDGQPASYMVKVRAGFHLRC